MNMVRIGAYIACCEHCEGTDLGNGCFRIEPKDQMFLLSFKEPESVLFANGVKREVEGMMSCKECLQTGKVDFVDNPDAAFTFIGQWGGLLHTVN